MGLTVGAVTVAVPPQNPAHAARETGGLDLDSGESSLLRAETRRVTPGLEATSFDRLQPEGWVTGDVLVADLSTPTLRMDISDSGALSRPAPLTEHALGENAVAAVNGSFFDINNSGVAQGTNISAADGLKTTSPAPTESLTLSAGIAAVQRLSSAATVAIGDATHAVAGVNSISIPADGLGYFTPIWGEYPLSRAIGGPANIDPSFLRVEVRDDRVVRLSADLAEITSPGAIATGTGVLLARGAAVNLFTDVKVGDPLPVTVRADAEVDMAISGNQRLVLDGAVVGQNGSSEPRTAAGVSADGTTVYIVSIDGRQSHSRGMRLDELGEFLVELGAHNAVNLDGGGSSSLLLREPGTSELSVANAPSDGVLRSVPNSLVFSSTAPSNGVESVAVAPVLDTANALNVFPGLSRSLAATGLDANLTAVAAAGEFAVNGDNATLVALDGSSAVVTGTTSGRAPVTFSAERHSATTSLRVLGPLHQLRASKSVIALEDATSTTTVRITGVDADGFTAPMETRDITVTSGPDVRVEHDGRDAFTIVPMTGSGAATVSFAVDGHRVDVAVTVGLEERGITDFADASEWMFRADRATGELTTAEGPDGLTALKLTYDFASSTGTRGAYAVAPAPLEVPGQPQAITMWLHGDGNSTWPRLQVKTGNGTTMNLDGPHAGWTGWQQVRFPVPTGTAFPLSIQRLRMMETSGARQYQGETMFAALTAVVAPDVAQPVAKPVHDPVVITNGTVDDRTQRIAVMSDAQFVARNPEGPNVQGARQTLREILAADPEMFIITGDFVDEAAPEDFDLARRILREEIGDRLPWIYVPGNHEVMGGPIQNFIDEFGPTRHSKRVGSTLIVTLDTSRGSFNASDATQLRFLEESLTAAANDKGITGVLVFAHHPVDDPKPSKDSQISDRLEARRFSERLAEFRADTGKSIAAVSAHAGVFHASSFDGVSSLLTGNSGKSPSGLPGQGGFTGWAMLGIEPGAGVVGDEPDPVISRTAWMRAEVSPRVDELTLGASAQLPSAMTVGEAVSIDATISQDGGRIVPVGWPMSAQWGGDAVIVDDGSIVPSASRAFSVAEAVPAAVLRLNPVTGVLTATGEGTATIRLMVGGKQVEHTVTVGADPEGPTGPEGPTDPEDPTDPERPIDPEVPVDPEGPIDSGDGATDAGSDGELATTGADPLRAIGALLVALALTAAGALMVVRRRTE